MSDAPEYIGVHFEEDHKMHGTWAGPAKGHIYVNILRHRKVIERAEAAEAKLAKAVESLIRIDELTCHNMPMTAREEQGVNREARAALKELKGTDT